MREVGRGRKLNHLFNFHYLSPSKISDDLFSQGKHCKYDFVSYEIQNYKRVEEKGRKTEKEGEGDTGEE